MTYRGTSERYGGVAVAIHWASALVIVGALAAGFQAAGLLDPVARTGLLRIHIPCGLAAVALTLARIGGWLADRRPDPISGMNRLQARLAHGTHFVIYAALVVMGASGVGMLVLSGAGAVPSGAKAASVLPDFWAYAPRIPHGAGARLLSGLLVLHGGAALYHQFIRRDGLMRRMPLGA